MATNVMTIVTLCRSIQPDVTWRQNSEQGKSASALSHGRSSKPELGRSQFGHAFSKVKVRKKKVKSSLQKDYIGQDLADFLPARIQLGSFPSAKEQSQRMNLASGVASNIFSQKCGAPGQIWSSLRLRRKRLTSGMNLRMCERPAAVSASAATASVAASEIEDAEDYTFTSIAAGDAEGSPVGSRGRGRKSSQMGVRRENPTIAREGAVKKKPSGKQAEREEHKQESGAQIDGGLNKNNKSSEAKVAKTVHSTSKYSQTSEKQGSQRLWIKKAQTVVPRKVASKNLVKINPVVMSTVQSPVNEVMYALETTTNSQGVAKVMTKFESQLTIQDLKQLLTDLGTGPEKTWAKAIQVFDWMHDMGKYDIDGAMYHSMLILLGKSKKMEIAEAMVERMKTDGLNLDSYIYTALVGGYVRSGNVLKGIATITEMRAHGLRPSVSAYNVLIDGCLKVAKGMEMAESLLSQMAEDGITPDRVTYTTMIIVYSRKGHFSDAVGMFQEMQLKKCLPDVLTYNAVLNAYSKLGDMQGLLEAYQTMAEQRVVPDTVTFNIILHALGRAGRTKDVCDFYQHMRKVNVAPDVTTCSVLVNAHGKARAWDELDSLIAEMERLGLQPDLMVYNSLISIYGKAGRFEQVELIVKSLQNSSGMLFDVITYNSLIDIYGKVGRLSDVIHWFSEMRKQGVKPDVRTFNALVYAYGRASEYEGVKEVLNLFRAGGSSPDLVFYHTLLFMFAKGAQYKDAWGVLEDMQQEGYTLTLEIYNSLLLVFGRSNAQEAVKLYSHMISSNVRPNTATFKTLVEVHARKGMVDECLKIYRKAKEFLGDEPNDSLLSSVCGACCNMRRTEQAEQILVELEEHGWLPSVSCFNWLVLGYGREGRWKKAELVLEGLNRKGLSPNAQSYTFLLDAYSLYGLYDKARDLRNKMQENGLISSISAYNCLLRYHVRSGRVDLALEVLDELQTLGVKPNHNTYTALISGYGGQDETLNAKIFAHVRDIVDVHMDPKHGIYSALLAAIPKCKSHEEASKVLGVLERLNCPTEISCILKDVLCDQNQEEHVWRQLADRFRHIDMNGFNLETQRNLQNALIDALWWFGWEIRALQAVRVSMDLGVFGQVFTWSKAEWRLDLSHGSVGAVQVLLLMWITSLRKLTLGGEEIPPRIRIILAEDWQLRLDENKAAIEAVEAHLTDLGAVYSRTDDQAALEMSGKELSSWLREANLGEKLFLVDSLVRN